MVIGLCRITARRPKIVLSSPHCRHIPIISDCVGREEEVTDSSWVHVLRIQFLKIPRDECEETSWKLLWLPRAEASGQAAILPQFVTAPTSTVYAVVEFSITVFNGRVPIIDHLVVQAFALGAVGTDQFFASLVNPFSPDPFRQGYQFEEFARDRGRPVAADQIGKVTCDKVSYRSGLTPEVKVV